MSREPIYRKGAVLYEGKGKVVYKIENQNDLLWFSFKDSLTAFNAQKKGSFANKGAINRDIASFIFRELAAKNIRSHWVSDQGEFEMICEKLSMIPLEVVVRNVVAGSFAKKFALEEGGLLPQPIVEFYYKKDELNDPFISDEQALYLKAVPAQKDLEQMKEHARAVNQSLLSLLSSIGVQLVDFKIEYGFNVKGEICLGDEITPDSCRLWDAKTKQKLDKDLFRRDLGGVAEGYQEILNRLKTLKSK